jgi:hypothetical protein
MSLLTLAIAAGVGTAVRVYNSSKTYSEAHVLGNTVLEELRNTLRFAENVKISDGDTVTFDSSAYGPEAALSLTEALAADSATGQKAQPQGHLKLTYKNGKTYDPLQSGAYSGYYIVAPQTAAGTAETAASGSIFTLDQKLLTVSFDIRDTKTNEVQASVRDVKIRLLNNGE